MSNPRKTGSSDVITRAYLDSLLVEMRHIDSVLPSTEMTLYGKTFKTPVMTAALSHMGNVYPNGMAEMAKGTYDAGAVCFSGMGAMEELDGMIQTGASVVKIIKTYADRDSVFAKIEHAEKSGALAVGMDIDHAFNHNQDYDCIEGMEMRPITFQQLKEYVNATKLPFVVKGVLSRQDAQKCAEAGVQGMIISHHNGRLDYAVPPLMILPEILKETEGKIPLFVDCSLQTGMDVFKALALGATACCVGRPLQKQLGESGSEGVKNGIEDITRQLRYTMAMTCSPDLQHIDPSVVRPGSFTW
ncbi:MAG: alpha-hydroxy-acid oxidizing protein [Clostridiales bacterium]|nr:alpha-hydroxy-acid oxidizing protein [Clostridiales bacterium]